MHHELATALLADDALEDQGMPDNDRRTCFTCQAWGTPEHIESREHKRRLGIPQSFTYDALLGRYRPA